MDENNGGLVSRVERLAAAASSLEQVLACIEASHKELHAKVDRIVAEIEEKSARDARVNAGEGQAQDLSQRLADVERENAELRAQAGRLARKTLSPLVSGLLSKNGVEEAGAAVDAGVLEKALASLSLEQRITVKAELARAGMIA